MLKQLAFRILKDEIQKHINIAARKGYDKGWRNGYEDGSKDARNVAELKHEIGKAA